MRPVIILLFVSMISFDTTAQSHYIPSTPLLSNDWRAGYFNSTDLNYGFGLSETSVPDSKYFYGLTTVNGYQFSRAIKVGVGIGASKFDTGMFWPVYLHFRYNIWSKRLVPFISFDGGYLLSFEDLIDESRFFANPSLGVHYVVRERLSLNFSSGLFHHSGGPNGRSSFINFKLGIEFKGRAWNQFMIIK